MKKPAGKPTTAAAQTGKSAFLAAFKKSPKLAAGLKHVADAKDPNAPPDIEDGTYATTVTGVLFGEYKGVPTVKVLLTVNAGPYKGTVLNRRYEFGKISDKSDVTEEEIFNRIGVDLERFGKSVEATPESLAAAFQELLDEKPEVQVRVVNNAKGYVNVYVNKLISSGSATTESNQTPSEDVNASDDNQNDDTNEAGGSEDASADEATASEADIPVEVGDAVRYTPKGAKKPVRCAVQATDPRKRICNLQQEDNPKNTWKAIPWDHVQFIMQGE